MAAITATSRVEDEVDRLVRELEAFPLVQDNGENMDSDWHRLEINLLTDCVHHRFAGRDFYAGGNMFIYFNLQMAKTRDFRGPDFFLIWDVPPLPIRDYWATWLEGGRYPDIIIELLSPTTMKEDLTTKKDVYERTFRTPEYFCYDPADRRLLGWRRSNDHYQPLSPNERGWLWSEELQLWLGTWEGTYQCKPAVWLRFFDAEGNLVPTRAEGEEQRAEAARQQAEAERQRAEDERQRAEAERQRAEAAEQELARLRALLAQQQNPPAPNAGSSS